ncbi:MAG: flagellar basal body protein, partial [Cyanobacteria bacterium]|nr:flagellar basal body protein [Cyanobacteriota bacterium]
MLNPAFFGIYNGYRGIAAAQAGLNTIGHNIANMNTPGYSRQQIELSAFTPYTTPNLSNLASQGQVGQGVVVQSTQRIRQSFLDDQFRNINTQLGQDSEVNDTLKSVESIMKETGNTGVGSSLQKFFDSAQDLSLHPESAASRTSFIQNAKDLVNAFKQRGTQLTALQTSLISTNSTSQLSSAVS